MMNHIISLGIVLLVAFGTAVIFVGMALFADIHDEDTDRDKFCGRDGARFVSTPDDEEDNVIFRS